MGSPEGSYAQPVKTYLALCVLGAAVGSIMMNTMQPASWKKALKMLQRTIQGQ